VKTEHHPKPRKVDVFQKRERTDIKAARSLFLEKNTEIGYVFAMFSRKNYF